MPWAQLVGGKFSRVFVDCRFIMPFPSTPPDRRIWMSAICASNVDGCKEGRCGNPWRLYAPNIRYLCKRLAHMLARLNKGVPNTVPARVIQVASRPAREMRITVLTSFVRHVRWQPQQSLNYQGRVKAGLHVTRSLSSSSRNRC